MVQLASTLLLAFAAATINGAPLELNKRIPQSAGSAGFKLQNGKDAQKLNAQFATLTADSDCTDGQTACVEGGFAQCVDGSFMVAECGGGLTCFALPLVNSAGTSTTCDTEADAIARIEATGATGGLTGDGAGSGDSTTSDGDDADADSDDNSDDTDAGVSASETQAGASATATDSITDNSDDADTSDSATDTAASTSAAATSSATAASTGGDFKLANGKAAQALNAQFASLAAKDSCTDGDIACVNGKFAQCVKGKYALTDCGEGLQCVALPLVNKPGTSVTCDTEDDALSRITNTGATGGLTG